MDVNLFDQTRDFDDMVYRNIVSLRHSEDLFDDLTADDQAIAIAAEMRMKKDLPDGMIQHAFHYSTAITYPFETQPCMASRYSDGSFPVWYGSLELETTIYETAFHMLQFETASNINDIVIRERAIYKVHCTALLIDLTQKRDSYPQLTAESYEFTQQIGHRLAHEGHPGLLAPSARCDGNNAVILNPQVLSNPCFCFYLNYVFNPHNKTIRVERKQGLAWMVITL